MQRRLPVRSKTSFLLLELLYASLSFLLTHTGIVSAADKPPCQNINIAHVLREETVYLERLSLQLGARLADVRLGLRQIQDLAPRSPYDREKLKDWVRIRPDLCEPGSNCLSHERSEDRVKAYILITETSLLPLPQGSSMSYAMNRIINRHYADNSPHTESIKAWIWEMATIHVNSIKGTHAFYRIFQDLLGADFDVMSSPKPADITPEDTWVKRKAMWREVISTILFGSILDDFLHGNIGVETSFVPKRFNPEVYSTPKFIEFEKQLIIFRLKVAAYLMEQTTDWGQIWGGRLAIVQLMRMGSKAEFLFYFHQLVNEWDLSTNLGTKGEVLIALYYVARDSYQLSPQQLKAAIPRLQDLERK